MKLTCKYCGNEWDYKGTSLYAYCPKCRTSHKIMTREELVKKLISV